MYRKRPPSTAHFWFCFALGGKLRKYNRWVILADLIPWDQSEDQYAMVFEGLNTDGESNAMQSGLKRLDHQRTPWDYGS